MSSYSRGTLLYIRMHIIDYISGSTQRKPPTLSGDLVSRFSGKEVKHALVNQRPRTSILDFDSLQKVTTLLQNY